MILLALTSCTVSEVEEWERMLFVCEETTIDESENISVPASGGTYHIKELKGEWTEATMQDNVLTVSIKPNKSGEKRKSELIIRSAGATGGVIFNQAAE